MNCCYNTEDRVRDRVWTHDREQPSEAKVGGASTCWETVMNALLNDRLWPALNEKSGKNHLATVFWNQFLSCI